MQTTTSSRLSVAGANRSETPQLAVRNLVKHYSVGRGLFHRPDIVHAVDDVSFTLDQGETLGLVGESGCGKSTTANVLMGLTRPTSGDVYFRGSNVTLRKGEMGQTVTREMQMVFQDPYSSLNPRLTASQNVMEPLRLQRIGNGRQRRERAAELFSHVGLRPEQLDRPPVAFSGGQRQRICIARALATEPSIVVLDEPVSALDVSVQAQVLNLLKRLQRELGLSYLFVSHDLSVVKHLCDRVAVMYLGKIVEVGPRADVFTNPAHPYTRALLSAVPIPNPRIARGRERVLLSGELPSPINPPSGCRFRTRCPRAQPLCADVEPILEQDNSNSERQAACHFPLTADSTKVSET